MHSVFLFNVADTRLDGGPPPEFAFDAPVNTALLAWAKDAAWLRCIMADTALIDIGAFGFDADPLGEFFDDRS